MANKPTRDTQASVRAANKVIVVPKHIKLAKKHMPFFRNITAEYANLDWTPHQIEIAYMLAKALSDQESERNTLRAEGFVVINERGMPIENSRARETNPVLATKGVTSAGVRSYRRRDLSGSAAGLPPGSRSGCSRIWSRTGTIAI